MKKIIRKLIYNFPIHLKKYIILESNPDLTDNTYSLFKILLKNKVNEKYKLFWFVDDKNMYKNINIKNVYFINAFGEINIFEKIKKLYINIKSKYIIDCNKLVYKKNINQKRLYLSHGAPYKLVADYCNTIGDVNYYLSLSPFFDNIISKLCHVDKDNIIDLGFPRNDDLFSKTKNIRNMFKNKNFDKIIIWLPTYRQRENKISDLSMTNSFELGIPIIYNIENLRVLNNLLNELNILLVLKPHPAQDLSVIKTEKLSNFILLTNQDLKNENINLYEFLGQTDALITDYSSVYYDYLLTNKPIAITTDDFDEYKSTFDFAFDNIFDVIKGEYINNFDELKSFINNVANENDIAKHERENIKKILHKFQDENSSSRVYEFLVKNMWLK